VSLANVKVIVLISSNLPISNTKRLKVFEFNEEREKLYPIPEFEDFFLENTWAQLGASVFFACDWDGNKLERIEAGISGGVGFNFGLELSSFSAEKVSEMEHFRKNGCLPDIRYFDFLSSILDCNANACCETGCMVLSKCRLIAFCLRDPL
jgi:hypothetical protein